MIRIKQLGRLKLIGGLRFSRRNVMVAALALAIIGLIARQLFLSLAAPSYDLGDVVCPLKSINIGNQDTGGNGGHYKQANLNDGPQYPGHSGTYHDGVDVLQGYSLKQGDPVYAPESGTVTYIPRTGDPGGRATLQAVNHSYVFRHLRSGGKTGSVKPGEIIGYTGYLSSDEMTHFEVWTPALSGDYEIGSPKDSDNNNGNWNSPSEYHSAYPDISPLDVFKHCTNPGTANVRIRKTDSRAITDLHVDTCFKINNAAHYDYEETKNFDRVIRLKLNGNNGTVKSDNNNPCDRSHGYWAGDFLKTTASYPLAGTFVGFPKDQPRRPNDPAEVIIQKTDSRAITSLRIYVWFKINGATHYDYEDIGNWTGNVDLELYAQNGVNCGGIWKGDFLYHSAHRYAPPYKC